MLVGSGNAPPIVFVTSHAEDRFEAAARQLGCLAYLRKPFASVDLLRALETVCPRWHKRDAGGAVA